MSQKMRRYSMIGLMAVAAGRSSVENQPAVADNEHSHPAQISGMDHSLMPSLTRANYFLTCAIVQVLRIFLTSYYYCRSIQQKSHLRHIAISC